MKKTRKGFTLVELLVVIAIVAILATVAIIGYTSFTKKAHESNDRTLVAELNTAVLRGDGQKYANMYEVAEAVKAHGFDVAKMQATAKDHAILWNMNEQRFFYTADETPAGENWVVSDTASNDYSTYYIGGTTIESNTSKSICVVTNGEDIIVNAPNATVYHYGPAGLIQIIATADNSYHEFGFVEKMEVAKGRVVIENTGSVSLLKVDEANAANVKLVVDEQGEVGALYAPSTMETTGNAPEASKLLTAADGWTIVTTLDELKAALTDKAEKIALGTDIVVSQNFADGVKVFTVDYSLELNLNSYTISATLNCSSGDKATSNALFTVNNGANFTVSGAGKISYEQVGNNFGWSAYSSTISVNQSNVTINDSVIVSHEGGTDMAYAIDVLTNGTLGDATLTVNGGVLVSPYRAIRAFCNSTTNKVTVIVNGGTVRSTNNNAIWFQNPNSSANNGLLKVTGGVIESNGYYEGADRFPISMGASANITKDVTGGKFVQNGTDVTSTYLNK